MFFTDDSKYFHGKRLSYSLCMSGQRARMERTRRTEHQTSSREIARDTFFRWLSAPWQSKTDSVMMVASNTLTH